MALRRVERFLDRGRPPGTFRSEIGRSVYHARRALAQVADPGPELPALPPAPPEPEPEPVVLATPEPEPEPGPEAPWQESTEWAAPVLAIEPRDHEPVPLVLELVKVDGTKVTRRRIRRRQRKLARQRRRGRFRPQIQRPVKGAEVVAAAEPRKLRRHRRQPLGPDWLKPQFQRAHGDERKPIRERLRRNRPKPLPAPEAASRLLPVSTAANASALRRQRFERMAGGALAVVGVVLILEAGSIIFWREPTTALRSANAQANLRDELERTELSQTLQDPRAGAALNKAALRQRARDHRQSLEPGQAVGRLKIPDIGLNQVFVEAASPGNLQRGPARYRRTMLPGERGTMGIAGHRTTWTAPFNKINELDRGDRITIEMPYGRFVYRVEKNVIVAPEDLSVLGRGVKGPRVVLTSCHPRLSDAKRIVVIAELVSAKGRV